MGGMATHVEDLCEYLLSCDFRVFIATCQPLLVRKKGKYVERRGNLQILRMPLFGWRHFVHSGRLRFVYETVLLSIAAFLLLLIHRRSIEVIHVHGHTASFAVRLLKSIFSKKAVLSTHNLFGFNPKKISNRLVRRSFLSMDYIWAVSANSRNELVELGVSAEKIGVYTHWVNQERFKPMDKEKSKEKAGWPGKFVALFIGRIEASKGAGVLADVATGFDGTVTFAFVGEGTMAEEIKEKTQSYGNIVFAGEVANKELPTYLNAADVLIIPTQGDEGFGRVVIEAFSCGVPVIGTARGRLPQIINDDVGIIVEPPQKDVETITKAVSKLYNKPEALAQLSKNAVKLAQENYNSKNARLIVESYK